MLLAFVPMITFAQASGGQIRRKPQTSFSSKPSRTQNRRRAEPHRQLTAEQKSILDNIVNNMVYIDGGTFMMGATINEDSEAWINESPIHKVNLSSFYIGRYEVTQEEWDLLMDYNYSNFKGSKHPVERVSWSDCQIFIKKLNELTGKKFRLPTEAEWEYAARGGNKSEKYSYSGNNNASTVGWYIKTSDESTHDVGTKLPNELGLYDMSGNVFEWCQDWYAEYSNIEQTNPQGPVSGTKRVVRGGGWNSTPRALRVSWRVSGPEDSRAFELGFRLALDL